MEQKKIENISLRWLFTSSFWKPIGSLVLWPNQTGIIFGGQVLIIGIGRKCFFHKCWEKILPKKVETFLKVCVFVQWGTLKHTSTFFGKMFHYFCSTQLLKMHHFALKDQSWQLPAVLNTLVLKKTPTDVRVAVRTNVCSIIL